MDEALRDVRRPPGVPDHLVMIRFIGSLVFPLALRSALEAGVFRALAAGPAAVGAIAKDLALDEAALGRVVRALAVAGIVTVEEGDLVGLTPLGMTLSPHARVPLAAVASYLLGDATLKPLMALATSLRGGNSSHQDDAAGGWYRGDRERSQGLDHAMGAYGALSAAAIAESYPFGGFARIVDIGGGLGHFLASILKAFPATRGVLLELPQTARRARDYLGSIGLGERCEVVEGDMFEVIPPGGNLYVLSKVLNNWDDHRAVMVLRQVTAVMQPDARLVLVEMLKSNTPSYEEVVRDIVLLTSSNGGQIRTAGEFEALLNSAGLVLHQIVETPGGYSLLDCRKV